MNWEARFKEGEQLVSDRRISEAIEHYNSILQDAKEEKKIFYWALKHLGDVIGYAGLKDYLQAIDIYQKIINEYEEAEDSLYNWCQVDIAKSYLELGIEMFDNFSSMMGIFEFEDNTMEQYLQKLITKRNEYIEREAEILFKEKM